MNDVDALKIVIELAEQNIIDDDLDMAWEHIKQTRACDRLRLTLDNLERNNCTNFEDLHDEEE